MKRKVVKGKTPSPWRAAVLEMLDEGVLNADTLARDLVGWCSEADIKEFCERNDYPLSEDGDEEG